MIISFSMVPEFWINKAPFLGRSSKSQHIYISMGTCTTWPKHNLTFGWNLCCHIQFLTLSTLKWKFDCVAILNNQQSHHKHIWKQLYDSSYRHIFGCLQKTTVKTYFCWPLYTSWMTCSLNFAVYDQKMHNIIKLFSWGKSWHKDKPIFCWHLIPLLPALDVFCQCWR